MLLTFQDAFDSVVSYIGAQPSSQVVRDVKQSICEAILELVNAHTWSYLYKHGRLNLNAPYTSGTIQYKVSSGSYPYEVTLSGGTWPTWAAAGYLQIGMVIYPVSRRISDSVLTVEPELASLSNMPAGTAYGLFQDTYELPEDFIAQDYSLYEGVFGGLTFIHPRDWLFMHRYRISSGIPISYTITGDPRYHNRLVARFSPTPSQSKTLDFIYKRRPRPLSVLAYETGTVTLDGSDQVVGAGTSWTSDMAGSVIRVSGNSARPTWVPGDNPAVFEGIIRSVESATAMTLMDPAGSSYSAAKYIISDPVDIETGSMANAFLRCCEKQVSQKRIMKDKPSARLQYVDELQKAKAADSRSFSGRAEGDTTTYMRRLRDMPFGPDMS